MGNSFCTKIDDTDDYGSKMNKIPPPAAGSYDQRQGMLLSSLLASNNSKLTRLTRMLILIIFFLVISLIQCLSMIAYIFFQLKTKRVIFSKSYENK